MQKSEKEKEVSHYRTRLFIFAILSAAFMSGCTTGPVKRPFKFENGVIRAGIHGKAITITNDYFPMVVDWSDDYQRRSSGIGLIENGWFIFKGAINHSRDIVFAYKVEDGRVLAFPNAKKATCSASGLWALIQMQPLYASESGTVSVVVEGREILNIGESQLIDLLWKGDKLLLTLAPQ